MRADERVFAIPSWLPGRLYHFSARSTRYFQPFPATDSTMKALGKSYEYQIFDGAGHGFLRGRDDTTAVARANVAAAGKAWPRTVEFLRAKLERAR